MAILDYTSECKYLNGISLINPYNFASGSYESGILDIANFYKNSISICAYGGGLGLQDPLPANITGFFVKHSDSPSMANYEFVTNDNVVGSLIDMNIDFYVRSNYQAFSKISLFEVKKYIQFGFDLTAPVIAGGFDARVICFAKLLSYVN